MTMIEKTILQLTKRLTITAISVGIYTIGKKYYDNLVINNFKDINRQDINRQDINRQDIN